MVLKADKTMVRVPGSRRKSRQIGLKVEAHTLFNQSADSSGDTDINWVWADPRIDLNRTANLGFPTVRLRENTTYKVSGITITKPVEIVGPCTATIALVNGATTGKILISSAGTVLRGFVTELPIEASERVCVEDVGLKTDATNTTTNGAAVEISGADAAESIVWGCTQEEKTAGSFPSDCILVRDGAESCVVFGNVVRLSTVGVRTLASLKTEALGTNAGVVRVD